MNNDECIYDCLKKKGTFDEKLYYTKSQHRQRIKNEFNKNKKPHQTMGYAQVPLVSPDHFLRKGTRITPPPPKIGPKSCAKPECLPPVPHRKDLAIATSEKVNEKTPKIGRCNCCNASLDSQKNSPKLKNKINWKLYNINKVTNMKPKQPEIRCIDKERGDVFALENSGLVPKYRYSDKFGKVPPYLKKIIESERREEQRRKEFEERTKDQSVFKFVSETERQEILTGLRANWKRLQESFNKLPILTDTIPKIVRKSHIERQLQIIERDILKIEENPFIYVYDQDN